MSVVEYSADNGASRRKPPVHRRALHRLAAVRRVQGVSRAALARSMKVRVVDIRRQEDAMDLPLSQLYAWQKALGVPIAELLAEPDDSLSPPLRQRAQLIRLMRTALTLLEKADNAPTREMAQTLVDQLVGAMPELQEVRAWNTVGEHRRLDDLGVVALRTISDDVFTGRVA